MSALNCSAIYEEEEGRRRRRMRKRRRNSFIKVRFNVCVQCPSMWRPMASLRESKFIYFKKILSAKFRQNVQHRWNCGTAGYTDTDDCCKVTNYITESLINLTSQNNYSVKAFTTFNHFCNF